MACAGRGAEKAPLPCAGGDGAEKGGGGAAFGRGSRGAETVAEAADDPVETAAVRLGQKLGLGATQEDDDSERETAFSADLAGTAAANAALLRAREAESADNASDWIRKLLSADGRDGASAAAARGKNDFSLAQEQEVRETESFSLSLERDARRYDGGFLFY